MDFRLYCHGVYSAGSSSHSQVRICRVRKVSFACAICKTNHNIAGCAQKQKRRPRLLICSYLIFALRKLSRESPPRSRTRQFFARACTTWVCHSRLTRKISPGISPIFMRLCRGGQRFDTFLSYRQWKITRLLNVETMHRHLWQH